jgi:hypothetical protein
MTSLPLRRRAAVFVSAMALCLPGLALAQTAAPAAPAPAAVRSDAREQVPAALLGVWKADIAASTYTSTPPREALRVFQYSADGKVLVMFLTVAANGSVSNGHWSAQVDGSDALEYHSNYGSTPYNVVTLTKVDDRNLNLVVSRNGVVSITGSYLLSEDGQTLTYKYLAGGKETTILYRRWTA